VNPRRIPSSDSPVPIRAVLAVLGTVLALVLLFSFKTPEAPPLAGSVRPGQVAVAPTDSAAGLVPGAAAPVAPSPARASQPARGGVIGGAAASPRVTQAPAAPAATAAPTARPSSSGAITADVAGPIESTPYGDVQVEVKIQNGKIVDVVALQLPYDRRRSAEISQYVEPILHDEALQAQNAQIDAISGATWTSGAYQASLQGALDKAANG
jgi:uncharacterized protein with FMN-binding domain